MFWVKKSLIIVCNFLTQIIRLFTTMVPQQRLTGLFAKLVRFMRLASTTLLNNIPLARSSLSLITLTVHFITESIYD